MSSYFSIKAKEYEKAYEYFKRAIMFGDFENSLLECSLILKDSSIKSYVRKA